MQIKKDELMKDFTYNTAYTNGKSYLESKGDKIGVLMFLRYYGCTICQLDIMEFNQLYEEFQKLGVDVKIVLQSSPEIIKKADEEAKIKFEIICDPNQELYNYFEIKAAATIEELKAGNIVEKVTEARSHGFSHGEYEGNELQLPAAFIIGKDNKVIYSHYGQDGADIPRAKEVLEFIKKTV